MLISILNIYKLLVLSFWSQFTPYQSFSQSQIYWDQLVIVDDMSIHLPRIHGWSEQFISLAFYKKINYKVLEKYFIIRKNIIPSALNALIIEYIRNSISSFIFSIMNYLPWPFTLIFNFFFVNSTKYFILYKRNFLKYELKK